MTREEYHDWLVNQPTPHLSYELHLTERICQDLMNAIKCQAMKDYINALADLRDDPHEYKAITVVRECETFFGYTKKINTVRSKVRFDGGLFDIICMENFPTHWGDSLPTKDKAIKCPLCKEGRINRSYSPSTPTKKLAYGGGKTPRIIHSCDICTFKYVEYCESMEDEYLMKKAKELREIALSERDRLCRSEAYEIFSNHPEYTQQQRDEVYRRLAKKWKV